MKAGTLLLIIADIIGVLEAKKLILDDGTFGDFSNLENDVQLANGIEDVLTAHGVETPDKVASIIQMLPIVFRLASK